jgi:hypothetical protein
MCTLSAFVFFSLLVSNVRAQCGNLPANKAEKLVAQINCSMLTTEEILGEVSSIFILFLNSSSAIAKIVYTLIVEFHVFKNLQIITANAEESCGKIDKTDVSPVRNLGWVRALFPHITPVLNIFYLKLNSKTVINCSTIEIL